MARSKPRSSSIDELGIPAKNLPEHDSALNSRGLTWKLAIAAGWLVYIAIFFSGGEERRLVWRFLIIADSIAENWVGKDLARFGVLDRIPVLIGTFTILLMAYLSGRFILYILTLKSQLGRLEHFVLATAIGLNLESLFVLSVGLMGQIGNRIFYATAGSLIVALNLVVTQFPRRTSQIDSPELQQASTSQSDRPQNDASNRSAADAPQLLVGSIRDNHGGTEHSISLRWLMLAVPFGFCCIFGGMLPPWQFDVREYHLQVPKEWFLSGRISFLPHNVYGNMPLGAELPGVIGMVMNSGPLNWWWGSLIGKTVIACFGPLTSLALFALGKRFVGARAGIVASVSYISLPWIVHESMAGLIEGALAFYGLCALYALLIWQQCWQTGKVSHKATGLAWVGVAGFLAGGAAACKYPGVLFVILPLFAWVLVGAVTCSSWRPPIAFGFAVLLGCGLWYGKNLAQTGNPTYPLLYSIFGGVTRTSERDEQWRRAHQVPRDYQGRKYTVPQLVDSMSLIGWRSVFLSPAIWPLCLGVLVNWRGHRNLIFIFTGLLLFNFAGWWLFTHRIDRFFVPAFVYTALLAGIGAEAFSDRIWNRLVLAFLAFSCLFSFMLMNCQVAQEAGDIRFLVALDDLRVDAPTEADPVFFRTHPARRYINEHVRDGSAVLLVGDAQPFDLEVPTYYNTCFDENIFEQLMSGKTRQERLDGLKARGISHIFFYWREIERYRSPGNYGYTSYVTKDLVRREIAGEQGLLRLVPIKDNPENSELYRVLYP